ncbi:hypothetical protein [Actinacidiphila rubida]|uniref:Uncharacterized protein n=1 Tax=Actinacidiphila rubida TaxID=310780 RepID=A0A1H8UD13_9ACTN|nr:hypothetical protein [Actinacidiphila rubida]SEP01110.1 hypothetical protein SAMN05216267_106922 [Actinacidiphila rubida]
MNAAIVTVALAFAGYLMTHWSSRRLAQRQERLTRVNRQLGEFYGPLLAITEINNRVYHAFAERHPRPDGRSPLQHGPLEQPRTAEELAEWQLWVSTVFLPNHRAMRELLLTRADLLAEARMPQILLDVYAHASWHEITAARWASGDLTEHQVPGSPVPATDIRRYARAEFDRLEQEQAALLGRARRGPAGRFGGPAEHVSGPAARAPEPGA